jgi:hypothetical protein
MSDSEASLKAVSPTSDEWRRLCAAALAFRDAAPWEWMTENDLFGVRDPETGVTFYACIMGELGEHRALAFYEGTEGLAGYWQIRLDPPDDPFSILLVQKCLMASFEDRENLDPEDRDMLKQSGVKVRGRGAWPLFRSYSPGYAPWAVTGPQARMLLLGLEQALTVARRAQTDPDSLPPPDAPGGIYLVREVDDTGWKDVFETPEPLSPPAMQEVIVEADRVQRLAGQLPKARGVWEIDYFLSPAGVRDDDGGRPFFPAIILTADQGSGMLLSSELSRPDAVAQDLAEVFLTVMENTRSRPTTVQVAQDSVQSFLGPLGPPLGIRIKLTKHLPALEAAQSELGAFLGGGGPGFDPTSLLDDPALLDELEAIFAEEEAPPPAPRRPRRTPSVRAERGAETGVAGIYQLKVTLRDSRPPIWRRILVPGDVRLDALHHILQAAMGWHDSHLHAFEIGGEQYGVQDPDLDMLDMEDERRVRLDRAVPEAGGRFSYEYDFGDSWDHQILVEKILPPEPGMTLPRCLTGRRACPPEDCGGIWGYAAMVEALADPKHKDHKSARRWVGKSFDPEAFSCEEIDSRLKRAV